MSRKAVEWLLESDEPAVRYSVRHDVLGDDAADDRRAIPTGPKVTALLAGQKPDGGFGGSPYRKWVGTHWRLVSLAELDVPADEPRVRAAAEHELAWIVRQGRYHGRTYQTNGGLPRVCASVDGNALAVSSRFGLADDPRARTVAESLVSWQWPDGGWNCDQRATGYRSSFHETLSTAWGLYEFAKATGDEAASDAADRAVELFLDHRLIYRLGTEEVINRRWLQLRYPSYWRYDLLRVLLLLSRMGRLDDPRAADALDELERRRRPDGRWAAGGRWWNPEGSRITPEVVDWGESREPNEMITRDALRVLRSAGRLDGSVTAALPS